MTTEIVYLVDDDNVGRNMMAARLEDAGISCQCFENAESFLAWIASHTLSGCLLLDISMPGMSGLKLQQELLRNNIQLPIIFLTGHGDIPTTVRAMKLGAVDFMTKPVNSAKLVDSIREIFRINRDQQQQEENKSALQQRLSTLTEREHEVLLMAIDGTSNKEIAQLMNISPRTIEIHRSHILLKTRSKSFLELARTLTDSGITLNRTADRHKII